MSGKTDGRRAYDAWWATAEGVPRHPDVTYDQDGAAWEAAAAAGAAAAHERAAELVTEGNELRAENGALRVIVAEVLARLEEALRWDGAPGDDAQIAKWSERAGLTPAVVTAGTEHLTDKITRLVIPDEDTP